jgi:hypothetical protein
MSNGFCRFFRLLIMGFPPRPFVDLKALIEGVRSLYTERQDDPFRVTYSALKDRLLSNLEELYRQRTDKR